MRSCQMLH